METVAEVTAVVLAGGLGSRLRSVVGDRPKVLAQVGSGPFLRIVLDQLAWAGVRRVVLCVGYLAEQVRAVFGYAYRSLSLSYSEEPAPAGTGGALRRALPLLENDAILALNGDSFCEVDLAAFWRWCKRRQPPAALVLARVADASRYGSVTMEGDQVVAFREKADGGGPSWVNAGVYYLTKPLIERIPSGRTVSLEREILPAVAGAGLHGYRSKGGFIDIGTPEGYAAARRFVFRVGPFKRKVRP